MTDIQQQAEALAAKVIDAVIEEVDESPSTYSMMCWSPEEAIALFAPGIRPAETVAMAADIVRRWQESDEALLRELRSAAALADYRCICGDVLEPGAQSGERLFWIEFAGRRHGVAIRGRGASLKMVVVDADQVPFAGTGFKAGYENNLPIISSV